MENSTLTTSQLIADSYVGYHRQVYLYILHKVNSQEEAEDLSQDVFLRLMEYKQMLRPDTVKFFIYTISAVIIRSRKYLLICMIMQKLVQVIRKVGLSLMIWQLWSNVNLAFFPLNAERFIR